MLANSALEGEYQTTGRLEKDHVPTSLSKLRTRVRHAHFRPRDDTDPGPDIFTILSGPGFPLLTYLDLEALTVDGGPELFFQFLESLLQLEHLRLLIGWYTDTSNDPAHNQQPISLPHLRTMYIHVRTKVALLHLRVLPSTLDELRICIGPDSSAVYKQIPGHVKQSLDVTASIPTIQVTVNSGTSGPDVRLEYAGIHTSRVIFQCTEDPYADHAIMHQAQSVHLSAKNTLPMSTLLHKAITRPLHYFPAAMRVIVDHAVDKWILGHVQKWLLARIRAGLPKLSVVDLRASLHDKRVSGSRWEDLLWEQARVLVADNTVEATLVPAILTRTRELCMRWRPALSTCGMHGG